MGLFGKLFAGGSDKEIKKLQPLVDKMKNWSYYKLKFGK